MRIQASHNQVFAEYKQNVSKLSGVDANITKNGNRNGKDAIAKKANVAAGSLNVDGRGLRQRLRQSSGVATANTANPELTDIVELINERVSAQNAQTDPQQSGEQKAAAVDALGAATQAGDVSSFSTTSIYEYVLTLHDGTVWRSPIPEENVAFFRIADDMVRRYNENPPPVPKSIVLKQAPADWYEHSRVSEDDANYSKVADSIAFWREHRDEMQEFGKEWKANNWENTAREQLSATGNITADYLTNNPTSVMVGVKDGEYSATWNSSVKFIVRGEDVSIADFTARYETISNDIKTRGFTADQVAVLLSDLDKQFIASGSDALLSQATKAGLSIETARKLSTEFSAEYLRLRSDTGETDAGKLAAQALKKIAADGWPEFSLNAKTNIFQMEKDLYGHEYI
jgi:hypothetical protein